MCVIMSVRKAHCHCQQIPVKENNDFFFGKWKTDDGLITAQI